MKVLPNGLVELTEDEQIAHDWYVEIRQAGLTHNQAIYRMMQAPTPSRFSWAPMTNPDFRNWLATYEETTA